MGRRHYFFNLGGLVVDISTMENAVLRIYNLAKGSNWVNTLYKNQIPMNNDVIISGAKFSSGATISRVTFAPGVSSIIFNGKTITPDSEDVGTWVIN